MPQTQTQISSPDEEMPVESWRKVFRDGFAPLLSTKGLEALRKALANDDPRLLQGDTTTPPPLMCVQDWPVEAACLIGFCSWQGDGLETVSEVEEYFARTCFECDQRLEEPAGCHWLLNWFDETPREEMRQKLLQEVDRELTRRKENGDGLDPKRPRAQGLAASLQDVPPETRAG